MKVTINVTSSFKRLAKPLLKKYVSLSEDLIKLETILINNPTLGIPLGNQSFKIRLLVSSKNKGKSGGLRVITHLETELIGKIEITENIVNVFLISIYDKSHTETISNKELAKLISKIHLK